MRGDQTEDQRENVRKRDGIWRKEYTREVRVKKERVGVDEE